MDVGDEQIYRQRDFAPSERVRIVGIDERKKSVRYEIEFLDGDKAGTVENIPASRLRGPWTNVRKVDEHMALWERFCEQAMDDHEDAAVEHVFLLLIPDSVAELSWDMKIWTTRVTDHDELGKLIGIPVADVLENVDWFSEDGKTVISPEGTLRIAEYACRVNPMPVLDFVIKDENEYRERSKRGRNTTTYDNRPTTTSPEREYSRYLEHGRPVHEMLRAWCGHRAVSLQERLAAAEAEVRRLDELLARVIDELKSHSHSFVADVIEQAHVDERITPQNLRPVVDRPLKPSEIPVRYERAPRRWGRW